MTTEQPTERLERQALTQLAEGLASGLSGDPSQMVGSRFGRYRVLGLLGSGGMGAVYLAEQTEPVQRRVAIKLVAGRRLDGDRLALFALERQALAHMAHPAIAQVFDAGATATGVPYLVMEFVEGQTLSDWLVRERPSIPQCVALLRDACLGVAHAHRRGIVHCDLKPGNILVTRIDGQPRPKIIDFGIARGPGHVSLAGDGSGTPGYMSPEQAGDSRRIDTRSDVYSLGLVLYEAIAGRRWHDVEGLTGLGTDDMRRRIEAAGPARLAAAGNRPHLPAVRARELGEIIARATATAPEQRYQGAEALAADLQRWLEHAPVEAMAGGALYRLRCLARRNALATTLAVLATLALALGVAGLYGGLREAERQAAVASARGQDLEQVVAFQQRLLGGLDVRRFASGWVEGLVERAAQAASDERRIAPEDLRAALAALPVVDVSRQTLLQAVLQPAAEVIAGQYADQPRVQAALRASLGRTLLDLALFSQSLEQLELAAAQLDADGAGNSRQRLRIELDRASAERGRGDLQQALSRLLPLPAQVAALPPGPPDTLLPETELMLSAVLSDLNRLDEARGHAEQAAARFREVGELGRALQTEAHLLLNEITLQGRCDLDLRKRMHDSMAEAETAGLPPRQRALTYQALGNCDLSRGASRSAATSFEAAYQAIREHSGEDDPNTQYMRATALFLAVESGRLDDAVQAALADAAERGERLTGPTTVFAVLPRIGLAELHSRRGEHTLALAGHEELATRLGGDDVRGAVRYLSQAYQGTALFRADRASAGSGALAEAEATCEQAHGQDNSTCLGFRLARLQKAFEADPTSVPLEQLSTLRGDAHRVFAEGHVYRLLADWLLVQALQGGGRSAEADRLRDTSLRPALDRLDAREFGNDEARALDAIRRDLARR
ncbi:MAG: serine/threonine protein kinase [Xanthomonadales bacterium]|nr:serine/threonine protein kinase [Xanthomonadales bacterium]